MHSTSSEKVGYPWSSAAIPLFIGRSGRAPEPASAWKRRGHVYVLCPSWQAPSDTFNPLARGFCAPCNLDTTSRSKRLCRCRLRSRSGSSAEFHAGRPVSISEHDVTRKVDPYYSSLPSKAESHTVEDFQSSVESCETPSSIPLQLKMIAAPRLARRLRPAILAPRLRIPLQPARLRPSMASYATSQHRASSAEGALYPLPSDLSASADRPGGFPVLQRLTRRRRCFNRFPSFDEKDWH